MLKKALIISAIFLAIPFVTSAATGAMIENFTVENNFSNRLPAEFKVEVVNTGDTDLTLSGSILVKSLFGRSVALLNLGPEGLVIPVGSQIDLTADWVNNKDILEISAFVNEIKNEWHQFAFGPHRAVLTIEDVISGDVLTKETGYFYVFPWRILLVALVAVILLMILNKIIRSIVCRRSGE